MPKLDLTIKGPLSVLKIGEFKSIILSHLRDNMDRYGFLERKHSGSDFEFIKKNNKGVSSHFYAGFTDYLPISCQLTFWIGNRFDAVEKIVAEIGKTVRINPLASKSSMTFVTSMNLLQAKYEVYRSQDMITEMDANVVAGSINNFMSGEGFSTLEKYSEIREINEEINSMASFWQDDINAKFTLGGNFNIKRLVIAKLAADPNFEKIVERLYENLDKNITLEGKRIDRFDISKPIPFTVHYLNNLILKHQD